MSNNAPSCVPSQRQWMKVEVGEGHKDLFVGTGFFKPAPFVLAFARKKRKKGDLATPLHLRVHLFP